MLGVFSILKKPLKDVDKELQNKTSPYEMEMLLCSSEISEIVEKESILKQSITLHM